MIGEITFFEGIIREMINKNIKTNLINNSGFQNDHSISSDMGMIACAYLGINNR